MNFKTIVFLVALVGCQTPGRGCRSHPRPPEPTQADCRAAGAPRFVNISTGGFMVPTLALDEEGQLWRRESFGLSGPFCWIPAYVD